MTSPALSGSRSEAERTLRRAGKTRLRLARVLPLLAATLDSDGDELEFIYRHMLEELVWQPGTLGVIFRKAQNRIPDPAKLKGLIVNLIDRALGPRPA